MAVDLLSRESLTILAAFAMGALTMWLITWPSRTLGKRVAREARRLVRYMFACRENSDGLTDDDNLQHLSQRLRFAVLEYDFRDPARPPENPRHARR